MNYKDENQTPRDRIDRGLYNRLYESEQPGHTERRAYPRQNVRRMPPAEEPMCCEKAPHPVPLPLAMVYAPSQEWRSLYDSRTALNTGSLFRELVFPWYPTPCAGKETCR